MIKFNIKRVLFFLSVFMILVSCNDDSEGIFDKSAAERRVEDLSEIKSELVSSEQGWVFDYFPHREQNIGGFTYIVKFSEDNNVEVYSESQGDFTTPETSLYDVISRGGSVLTFHEYNTLFHQFSTPSSAEYQAQGGDYEFTMSKVDVNTLKAKGVVTGNNLFLRKNTEDPETFLTKLNAVSSVVDKSSMFLQTGDSFELLQFQNRNITFWSGLVGNQDEITVPIIYTTTGIRFYEPVVLNGVEVNELTLTGNTLVNDAAAITIELVFAPIDMSLEWVTAARAGIMPQTFIDAFTQAKTLWDPSFGGGFPLSDVFAIGDSNITFSIGGTVAVHGLNFSGVLGDPTQLDITKGSAGTNWSFVPMFDPMVDMLVDNSPYVVTILDEDTSLLTSAADATFSFFIFK